MRGLRVVLMVALVVLMAGGFAVAQARPERPGRGARGERGFARGAGQILNQLQELDLTDEQRAEIQKLQADFQKRMEELQQQMRGKLEELRKFRQENPNDQEGLRKKREEMREQMAPLREAAQGFIEEVKGVLNEEQLKKFNELMAQRGGAGAMGRGARMGRGAMQALIDLLGQLGLTNEQQQKIDVMRANFEKKIAAEAEARRGQQGARRMLRQMPPTREQMQTFIEEVKTVLDEAQLKKFNELLEQRGGLDGLMGAPGGAAGRFGRGAVGAVILGLTPRAMEDMKLTEEQKNKLNELARKLQDEQQQILQKYRDLVKEVLTPEQAEQYEKAVTEMRDRFQNRIRGGRRGEFGNRQRRGDGADGQPPAPPE